MQKTMANGVDANGMRCQNSEDLLGGQAMARKVGRPGTCLASDFPVDDSVSLRFRRYVPGFPGGNHLRFLAGNGPENFEPL
jgi:hypothetical protein